MGEVFTLVWQGQTYPVGCMDDELTGGLYYFVLGLPDDVRIGVGLPCRQGTVNEWRHRAMLELRRILYANAQAGTPIPDMMFQAGD